ncbi:MAG: hypothetical protein HY329_08175 [Chloroflexi bacterium]|nr:hypothetical protein [Chloroflexota bacterium]
MITEAFTVAAEARAQILGLPDHPIVVADHPIASKTRAEMQSIAARLVDQIAAGLTR